MPWFQVDDDYPTHPGVLATSLAARGLWVTAGTWSSKRLTDVVPDHVVASFGGTPELCDELCTARVWKRVRGAYRFIQDGTCKIPSKEAVENDRAKAADRKRRQRARHAGVTPPVTPVSRSGQPVGNSAEVKKPSSEEVMSRRDSRGDNGVTLDPDPNPNRSVVVDVDQSSADRNGRASLDDPLLQMITTEILAVTGRHISPEWAARTRDNILAGRTPDKPGAYIRSAIRNEPDPKTRFLPLY